MIWLTALQLPAFTVSQVKDYCQNRGVYTRGDCIADENCAWCWGLGTQEGDKWADCFNLEDRPQQSASAPGLTCDPANPPASVVVSAAAAEERCCAEECPTGQIKTYSVVTFPSASCGESCLEPEDFDKYKKWEPNMETADSMHPCLDRGYGEYRKTETHGKMLGLPITVDLYGMNSTMHS